MEEIDNKITELREERQKLELAAELKDVPEITADEIERLERFLSELDGDLLLLHMRGKLSPGAALTDEDLQKTRGMCGRCFGDLGDSLDEALADRKYVQLDDAMRQEFIEDAEDMCSSKDVGYLLKELKGLFKKAQKSNIL